VVTALAGAIGASAGAYWGAGHSRAAQALIALITALVPGKDGGGERKERHDHQQQGIQEQYDPAGCTDVVELDMVVSPHPPDEQECDGVGEIGRPERDKTMQQVLAVSRRLDLQNEQRDRDGEDAIVSSS
jgi:hypothetical protein